MIDGKVDENVIKYIPEELREDLDEMVCNIEAQYETIRQEIEKEFSFFQNSSLTRKELGLLKGMKYKDGVFLLLSIYPDKFEKLDKYIMTLIKPKKC